MTIKTFADFRVGQRVLFGRKHGEQTLGEIVKLNPTKAKVKQLESRGTMRDYPIGTVWGVPYRLMSDASGSKAPPPINPALPPSRSIVPASPLEVELARLRAENERLQKALISAAPMTSPEDPLGMLGVMPESEQTHTWHK